VNELEQLRQEVKRLREQLARLEVCAQPVTHHYIHGAFPQPLWVQEMNKPTQPRAIAG
jgi:hypothetical protein